MSEWVPSANRPRLSLRAGYRRLEWRGASDFLFSSFFFIRLKRKITEVLEIAWLSVKNPSWFMTMDIVVALLYCIKLRRFTKNTSFEY